MAPRDEDGRLDYEQELNIGVTVGCPVVIAAVALSLVIIWMAQNLSIPPH